MHKRFKLQKSRGVLCDKKSRFSPRDLPSFFIDDQEDEKQFYVLNHFPAEKVKTGLEKESMATGAQNRKATFFSQEAEPPPR